MSELSPLQKLLKRPEFSPPMERNMESGVLFLGLLEELLSETSIEYSITADDSAVERNLRYYVDGDLPLPICSGTTEVFEEIERELDQISRRGNYFVIDLHFSSNNLEEIFEFRNRTFISGSGLLKTNYGEINYLEEIDVSRMGGFYFNCQVEF